MVLFYLVLIIFCSSNSIKCLDLSFEEKIVAEYGPSNDPFFPYSFGTGAGNREELVLKRILVADSSWPDLKAGQEDIWQNRWISLRLPDSQLIASATRSRVTVLRAGPAHEGSPQALYLHHSSTDMKGGVGPIELIEHWNRTSYTKQPFLLVATSDYGMQALSWFKILSDRLEELNRLGSPAPGNIVNLRWVREDDTELLIIMSHDESGRSKIDISEYMLDDSRNPHMFKTVCLEKTYIDAWVSNMEAVFHNDRVFITVIQNEIIQVFVYDLLEKRNGLQKVEEIDAPGVSSIKSFKLANRVYFAFNGYQGNFLQVPLEGYNLRPVLPFSGYIEEWLLLPVATYRSDVVALARGSTGISIILWRGSAGFVSVPGPPCFLVDSSLQIISELREDSSCLLDGNWTSAIVLEVGDNPAVLMPRNSGQGIAVYHMDAHLVPTKSPGAILRKMQDAAVHIHERLKCLGEEIESSNWLEQRSHLPEDTLEEWPDLFPLDTCLATLDEEVNKLDGLVQEKKANNIRVSMYVDHGKLSGNSTGKVFNESVEVNFSGNLVYGPMRSSTDDYRVFLDADVTLNNSRKYHVKTSMRLGSLQVSREGEIPEQVPLPVETEFPLQIAPDPTISDSEMNTVRFAHPRSRVDQPLHTFAAGSLYAKRDSIVKN